MRGVTLLELIIVVAVIGILAAIAYPSYQAYLVRAARADAAKLVASIASRQQLYLLDARAYTATLGAGGLNLPSQDGWTCAASCSNGRYTIDVALVAGPPIGFIITATPSGAQAVDGPLTLDSAGVRTRVVASIDKGW
jgi:type IV pilus assembly protein PilE